MSGCTDWDPNLEFWRFAEIVPLQALTVEPRHAFLWTVLMGLWVIPPGTADDKSLIQPAP